MAGPGVAEALAWGAVGLGVLLDGAPVGTAWSTPLVSTSRAPSGV